MVISYFVIFCHVFIVDFFSWFTLLFIFFTLTCCEHHLWSVRQRSKHIGTLKMTVSIFNNTNLTIIHTDQDTNLLIQFSIIFFCLFVFLYMIFCFCVYFKCHILSIFVVISFSLPFNIFAHIFVFNFTYIQWLFFYIFYITVLFWGKVQKNVCSTKGPKEHSGLHYLYIKELKQSWLFQTSGQKGLRQWADQECNDSISWVKGTWSTLRPWEKKFSALMKQQTFWPEFQTWCVEEIWHNSPPDQCPSYSQAWWCPHHAVGMSFGSRNQTGLNSWTWVCFITVTLIFANQACHYQLY